MKLCLFIQNKPSTQLETETNASEPRKSTIGARKITKKSTVSRH